jgi:hypothetical protein
MVVQDVGTGEYEEIRFFRSASDPEVFFFLPARPGPEKDSAGRPTLLMLNTGSGSSLQLGTRWEADASTLERLREHLAEQFAMSPALVTLRPVGVDVSAVTLALGNGAGDSQELQRSRSSGFAPLAALFNVALNAEQTSYAMAALNGRPGFLQLRWQGTWSIPGQAPGPIEATTDVADWFRAGSGLTHVVTAGSTTNERARSMPSAVDVTTTFDAAGAPVALVEVASTSGRTHLAGPRLGSSRVDALPDEMLVLKTTYTVGGAPYETRTGSIGAGRYALTPADLGLAMVTVDGTERRRAGASSLQIAIKYLPNGLGTQDETVLRFRYGEWKGTWFVITRSAGLDGRLEYAVRQIAADGATVDEPSIQTGDPDIRL